MTSPRITALLFVAVFLQNSLIALQAGAVRESSQEEVELSLENSSDFAATALVTWDSRYVSEGRDNLDGEGISAATLDLQYHNFLFGAWLSYSDGAPYEERDFYAEYGFETGPFEGYISYTYLQFPRDMSGADNEVGTGVAVPELICGITPGIDWYYSFDAEGSFMDFTLSREIPLTDRLHFEPVFGIGWNEGYISDGHDGANNVSLLVYAHYHITKHIALRTHIAQNWALNSDPAVFAGDSSLFDFFHGGVGVSVSF